MRLETRELTKRYYRDTHELIPVDRLDFTLEAGDFVCLLGRSGSGKTTLLNMMAGLLTPDHGEVLIDGVNLFAMNDRERTKWRNEKIGYVPQGQSLLGNLTAVDNVRLPFHLQPRAGASLKKAADLLTDLGVAHLANSYPASLSGGELRRVALARALMNSPELLIADEPTSDLDLETAREIMALMSLLNDRGVTLLVATHDLELSQFGQRVLKISSGLVEVEESR
ncbi:MAG: ABC transporter ATP-binding protein [Candidatus Adiutrix sp.]|jgi:putative ABC transport system ATP-binding protein|nr:ABC transporter ATP-binding protein [Candidatus Adiutrix sp.]